MIVQGLMSRRYGEYILSETLTEVLMFWMKMVTTVIWLIVVNKKRGDPPFYYARLS